PSLAYLGYPAALLLQGRIDGYVFAVSTGVGVAGVLLSWQLATALLALDRESARRFLDPDPRLALERRVAELAASRAAVVAAVDEERRRIERDLHDGVQQRIVALGVLLGRARRSADPERAARLLAEAHEESGRVLADLRDVVQRVYPAALEADGLVVCVRDLAARAAVPTRVVADVPAEPPPAVALAAWFVVCEALTNVAKHARAGSAVVELRGGEGFLRVRVGDDGSGGADPAGSGLRGLARRVAAVDGQFAVRSPAGGPTEVEAVLPCG
ncbi:sensor histidine kinase, partial [Kineococcus glutinatus]|uniref:sensor histidine kinase n=1 Tax=Kineococcus glutinatus TaxID=1070872 RepID=UPI0031EAF352